MGVAVAIAVVGFGALVGLALLGTKASTKYTQIPMNDDPVVTWSTEPSVSGPSATTAAPLSPAVVDPEGTILNVCQSLGHDQQAVTVPEGFDPIPAGGTGSFAQVVRPVYDQPKTVGAFDLGSGAVESSLDATRLKTIAVVSSVVVCVTPEDQPRAPALLCASPKPGMDGSPESYSVIDARRYRVRAFELASGRMLGEGAIQADVSECQDGYSKVASSDVGADEKRLRAESHDLWTTDVDVTDDAVTSWAVDHLKGGTYR